MTLSDHDIVLLEQYLEGTLDARSSLEFRLRLKEDAAFAQAVENYVALEQDLRALEQEQEQPKGLVKSMRKFGWAAAVAGVILVGALWFLARPSDTSIAQSHWPTHPGIPVFMSEPGKYNQAMNAYKQADYRGAIAALESMQSDTASFFRGCALFELEAFPEAQQQFEAVPEASSWYEEAYFRLALAHLADEEPAQARTMLEAIVQRKGKEYRRAQALLDEL